MMKAIVLATAMAVGADGACAATMTFTGTPENASYEPGYDGSWFEDGILAMAGSDEIAFHGIPDSAHMDDRGAPFPSQIMFTMLGRVFDAVSLDMAGSWSKAEICTDTFAYGDPLLDPDFVGTTCEPYAFANVLVSGYRQGVEIASLAFDMFNAKPTFAFSKDFRGIDALSVSFASLDTIDPTDFDDLDSPGDSTRSYFTCDDAPCTHFNIDNVTLAPVPLPATVGLLGMALAGLWVARRRR